MTSDSVVRQLEAYGVVPVVELEKVETALPLADALHEGGLPVVEITFRTAAAAEAIRVITRERPRMLVGAGTILTTENLEAARSSGAAFGVAPGLNPVIVRQAHQAGLPFIPGVATATEIEQAISLGCRFLKFFPAEPLGGVAMLSPLAAPFRHVGVRFMPTGGIQKANIASYLKLDLVVAVGGSWVANRQDFASGAWEDVRRRAAEAVSLVKAARNL